MDKALYIAMTGAKHNMLAQVNRSNNLANISTTGFKAEFSQARAMPVYYGEGQPTRAYALTEIQGNNFKVGPMIPTGRDLDIAVQGDGFIAVQANDGGEAYTRAGSLQVDALGVLRNGSGLPVMGNGGPIAIPPAEKVEVSIDGSITIIPIGGRADETAVVERIRLVNPDVMTLKKGEDGLFRPKNPEDDVVEDATVRVVSRFIEGSNVNAVEELIGVLTLSRQYEMQVKLMQTAKEGSEASARLLQQS